MSRAVVHAQRVQTFDIFGGLDPSRLGLFEVVFQIGFFDGSGQPIRCHPMHRGFIALALTLG